ncbi:MAG: hypothetical protein H0X61_14645 [Acidimicrobiia bacterium]|nr:hypothetical protein [Acidimicrobiia bacterium]
MQITIHGRNLPGRRFTSDGKALENVHVAVQDGKEPVGHVPGDARPSTARQPVAHQLKTPAQSSADRDVSETGDLETASVLTHRQRVGDASDVAAARSAPSASVQSSSVTTSLTPIRPPGRNRRCISANTVCFSVDRLMTQFEMAMPATYPALRI